MALKNSQASPAAESPALTVTAGGLTIAINADALRPLLEAVVIDVLNRIGTDGRIAYSETEAAALLGVARHVLRDARLDRKVRAAKVGRGVRYTRSELMRLLNDEPIC